MSGCNDQEAIMPKNEMNTVFIEYNQEKTIQEQTQAIHIEDRTRNHILNDGKKLSLMTVNSNIMDNSADILFDYFIEESNPSHKEDEDEYLTFQLCEGEQMNNEMANFIGIHMLNDGYVDGEDPENKDQEGGLNYQCPKTGSHFEYMDFLERIRSLK